MSWLARLRALLAGLFTTKEQRDKRRDEIDDAADRALADKFRKRRE